MSLELPFHGLMGDSDLQKLVSLGMEPMMSTEGSSGGLGLEAALRTLRCEPRASCDPSCYLVFIHKRQYFSRQDAKIAKLLKSYCY